MKFNIELYLKDSESCLYDMSVYEIPQVGDTISIIFRNEVNVKYIYKVICREYDVNELFHDPLTYKIFHDPLTYKIIVELVKEINIK